MVNYSNKQFQREQAHTDLLRFVDVSSDVKYIIC